MSKSTVSNFFYVWPWTDGSEAGVRSRTECSEFKVFTYSKLTLIQCLYLFNPITYLKSTFIQGLYSFKVCTYSRSALIQDSVLIQEFVQDDGGGLCVDPPLKWLGFYGN